MKTLKLPGKSQILLRGLGLRSDATQQLFHQGVKMALTCAVRSENTKIYHTFVCVVVQNVLCFAAAAGLIDDDSVHPQ